MRGFPLPTSFVDSQGNVHNIRNRPMPYYMTGTLDVAAATPGATFPASTFDHNLDVPFEILRWVPRVTTYVSGTTIQSDPAGARVNGDELFRWVKMKIEGKGRTRAWMSAMALLSTLVPAIDQPVELDAPYYLEKGAGLTITIDNNLTAGLAAGGIRMELCFHGFLIECD